MSLIKPEMVWKFIAHLRPLCLISQGNCQGIGIPHHPNLLMKNNSPEKTKSGLSSFQELPMNSLPHGLGLLCFLHGAKVSSFDAQSQQEFSKGKKSGFPWSTF